MDDSDGYALRAETLGATNVGNMLRMLLRELSKSKDDQIELLKIAGR